MKPELNSGVMDEERSLAKRADRDAMEASMDERRLRLSQGCDKNAQCRKRNRIPREWTYMPDDIRRNKHRKKMLSSLDFIGDI